MNKKHEPHFACFVCGDERTFPADHLRIYFGDLWCDDCWHYKDTKTGIEYTDLPQFVPEADLKIQALTEGLIAIMKHMEFVGGGRLGTAWHIADATLKKAEAVGD